MRDALSAPVQIEEIDLNGAFRLPRPFYNAVFFMGALYHLKNPLTVLEELAKCCTYLVLTTRVTRYAADRRSDIGSLPVAYLVDRHETNNDSTNYWIFTPAGLRRVLKRANWRVSAMMTRGAAVSDPVSPGGDERAYCFLRSAHYPIDFLRGVHPPEPGGWRWTGKRFSLRIWRAPLDQEAFVIPLFIPENTLARLGPITVSANVGTVALPAMVLDQPGTHNFPVPRYLSQHSAKIEFSLDKAFPAGEIDSRELGLVIPSFDPNQE